MMTNEEFFKEEYPIAIWHPIYYSAYSSSEEVFCIGVVALYPDTPDVAFKQNRLSDFFNEEYARGLEGVFNTTRSSLEEHFLNNRSLVGWVSPFEGISLGSAGTSTSPTLGGVLVDALSLSSDLWNYAPN